MDEKFLTDLKPNQKARVAKIKGEGFLRRRILDMGIVSGTEIEIERVAPLGDPIEIKIKGYHLSLRKSEAEKIVVQTDV